MSRPTGPDGVERAGADPGPARDTQPLRPLLSLSDEDGGAPLPFVVVTATSTAAGLHDVARRRAADLLVIGASRRVALEAARRLAAKRRAKLLGFEAVKPRPARDPFDAPHEIDERIAAALRRLAALGDVEPHVVAKPVPAASEAR